jgi:hypothetical protein
MDSRCHDVNDTHDCRDLQVEPWWASGTGTLNQYIEPRFDAQMPRTARRPLAADRLKPSVVLWLFIPLVPDQPR